MHRFVEMQAYVAVVEAGSFVKAAEALHVSKAAVSRYVGEVSRQLSSTRMILCASPTYLAYTLLAMGEHWAFEVPQGSVTVNVTPRMRANSGEICCAAALQHQGIVLQPSFLVGSYLNPGRWLRCVHSSARLNSASTRCIRRASM